jgi:hypothetical protein
MLPTETLEKLQTLLESEESIITFDHWYDHGEWISVSIENEDIGSFEFCTCDETSIRADYKINEEGIDRTIVVEIEHQSDNGCNLLIRALGGFRMQIRKNISCKQ